MENPIYLITLAVSVLFIASPLLALVQHLSQHVQRLIIQLNSHDSHNRSLPYIEDEFFHPEPATLKQVLLRAAGFALAREHIDNTSELEESQSLLARLRALQGLKEEGASNGEDNSLVDSISYADLDLVCEPDLMPAVNRSRENASNIFNTLLRMSPVNTEYKEKYLVSQFLLEYLSKPSRRVAEKYLFAAYKTSSAKAKYFRGIVSGILLAVLTAVMAIILTLKVDGKIVLDRIGPDSFELWLLIAILVLSLDLFILQPAGVFFRRVLLVGYFKAELNIVAAELRDKSKLILMRSHGVIRSYLWYSI